jgi:hypothetical protein
MKVLKYYSYRKAWARGNAIFFPRETMYGFEKSLAQLAGVTIHGDGTHGCGNHTCFLVELDSPLDKVVRSFMFTDFLMIMGDRIDEGNW